MKLGTTAGTKTALAATLSEGFMPRRPHRSSATPLAFLGLLLTIVSMVWLLHAQRAAAGSPGFQMGGDVARLQGRVYGEHGQNLSRVRVQLETPEGDMVAEEFSDDQGRYSFGGLTRGVYHLTAIGDGYETYRQTVDLTRSAFHTIVDIGMSPLKGSGGPPGEPPALTDMSAPKKAKAEYQKGMQALAANRIPDAKAHFSKAVEEYPCYARAQTAVALGFISDRDLPHAEEALKKSISCDPGFSSAYLKLGELYNIESRFRESEPLLQEGLRRQPGLWKFHYQLGVAYYGLGAYDKAQEAYLRSESLDPPAPAEVHVKLADVYFKERQVGKAYAEMQAYLSAEPQGQFSEKVKDIMRQLDEHRTARATTPASAAPASDQP
jgi:Tfp pilus assembly protein PilF